MVEGRPHATPNASIPMVPFCMEGMIHTFTYHAPLHGKIHNIIKACVLIHRPAEGTMIDDDIAKSGIRISRSHTMRRIVFDMLWFIDSGIDNGRPISIAHDSCIAKSTPDVPHNYITGLDRKRIILQTDPVARCCLACNSNIPSSDF